jgi:peptidoglycan/xylan/chitin deacetylase (PgdA/CDA1 family)
VRPFVFVRDAFLLSLFCLALLVWKEYLSWWWIPGLCGLYLGVLAIGATLIRLNFFISSLHHGDRNGRQVALTFDDGPAEHTAEILDVLRQQDVPAAFFSIGRRAAAAPEMVRRLAEEGHLIGNHSYDHSFHFDWQGRGAMLAEIEKTNGTIFQITGKRPRLFRPPYGVTNPELSHAVNLANMISVGWSLRSFDTNAKDAGRLLKRITKQVKGGDVILLHDSVSLTAGILTALIQSCREKGFTFVRLDKLLDIDAYA